MHALQIPVYMPLAVSQTRTASIACVSVAIWGASVNLVFTLVELERINVFMEHVRIYLLKLIDGKFISLTSET